MGKGDCMNQEEREFYDYLNSMSDNMYDNWLDQATDDELDLVCRLFDEVKYSKLDEVKDLSDAQSVLKQFTLRG